VKNNRSLERYVWRCQSTDNVAADEQTDLIVIGVHGRNPVDMALFGSTTNKS
jgi:hypothetical protein